MLPWAPAATWKGNIMALLLAEAEKLSLPMLQRGVIDNVITSDQLFGVVPFLPMDGKVHIYNRENDLGDAEFYDVNDALSESAATFTELDQQLKRIIGQVDVDDFLQSTMSDQQDQTAIQIGKKSKVVGRKFADTMVNGNVAINAKEFDGLRKILAGLGASQLDVAAVQGAALSYDYLDWLIDAVKIGDTAAFVMNSRTIRSYVKLQRALGGTTPETVSIGGTVVNAYRGRPILKNDWVPVDEDSEGTSRSDLSVWAVATAYVIGDKVTSVTGNSTLLFKCTTAGTSHASTEPTWDTTPGNTTNDESPLVWTTMKADLASIFHLYPDETEGFHGLMSRQNAGIDVVDVGPVENKDAHRYRVRWYTAVVLKAALALAGVRGVNN